MATLLIIEDTAAHRDAARRAAEAAGLFDEILAAEDGIRGLRLLLEARPDVVLCDLEMPGLDGEKLLHARSTRPELAGVPFLFLTASEDVRRRSRLLHEGACDAISKPFHPEDLIARLRLHLRVKQLQDELVAKNAALEQLSRIDSLTGLHTRRVAEETLAGEVKRARRHGIPLAIAMADLDHFKQVNDRHGHQMGDAVLQGVSKLLQRQARATDLAARYGGEEVIAVLPQTNLTGATQLAERWRAGVEAARFEAPGGAHLGVTVSIGIAVLCGAFDSPERLVAAADRALYRAKHGGRNRVEVERGEGEGDD